MLSSPSLLAAVLSFVGTDAKPTPKRAASASGASGELSTLSHLDLFLFLFLHTTIVTNTLT